MTVSHRFCKSGRNELNNADSATTGDRGPEGALFFLEVLTISEEKRIEMITIRAGDIKTGFGNPRKITKKKLEELCKSIELYGNFGVFVIDEYNNIIAGNQRLKAVLRLYGEDYLVECKKLYGYSEEELKEINLKDNLHSGEWDLDILADWAVDLNKSLSITDAISDSIKKDAKTREIDQMELLPLEKYNYVIIVCNNSLDYDLLAQKLGISNKSVLLGGKRRVEARAVWFNDIEKKLFGGTDKSA